MFSLCSEGIEPEVLKRQLGNPSAGACATFEGWVRDHNEGKTVIRLEYEAYEELALKEGERILAEAREKFGLIEARCTHRVGSLEIGELAVWVGASAGHRDEAFRACRYIIDAIKTRVPIWKKEFYSGGDSGWVNCERCAAHGHGVEATDTARNEAAYYSRQTILPEVGLDGQRRLKASRVLVVGAGGLGCPALQFLAAAGVGTIGICDGDRLEVSNLHRQTLYRYADIGEPKAKLAERRVSELNPFIQVNSYVERLDSGNAEKFFKAHDLVLDCTDNFETKYLLNDTAVATGVPLIQAGVYKFEGQIHICDAKAGTGCLRCLWPEIPAEGCVGTCVEVGVLGTVPGFFGTLQATEALKYLLDLPGALCGEMLVVNLLKYHVHRMVFQKNPACPACSSRPGMKPELAVRKDVTVDLDIDVASLTPETLSQYEIIDIREPSETQTRPLREYPCREIPMSQFNGDTLQANGHTKYLLCCAHGVRSRNLAMTLRRRGHGNVYSLQGGIAAIDG